MPRNNREWAQRKIDSAVGNLEKAAGHLLQVAELYENEKVEYVSKNCFLMVQAMSELPTMVELVKKEVDNQKQVDHSEIFSNVQKSIDSISDNLTVIMNQVKDEPKKEDPIKAKGVIDSIMIINQGLHDLKHLF